MFAAILLATVLVVALLLVAALSICWPLTVTLLATPPPVTVKVEILGVPENVVGTDVVELPVTTGATATPALVAAESICTAPTVMPVIAPVPVTVMVEVTGLVGAANAVMDPTLPPGAITGEALVASGAVTVTTAPELVAL